MRAKLLPIIMRGLRCTCPQCGQGRLFSGYLKQVDACASCGEKLGHIRADDGPAWLTIIIVGHLLAPVCMLVLPRVDWPVWMIVALLMPLTLALTLWLLPRAKGVFIGILWRNG